jgi:hypothetical protein
MAGTRSIDVCYDTANATCFCRHHSCVLLRALSVLFSGWCIELGDIDRTDAFLERWEYYCNFDWPMKIAWVCVASVKSLRSSPYPWTDSGATQFSFDLVVLMAFYVLYKAGM